MELEDVLSLAIPGAYLALLAVERMWPARGFPKLAWWKLTGAGFFLLMGAYSALLPLAIPQDWLRRVALFDLSGLGVISRTSAMKP